MAMQYFSNNGRAAYEDKSSFLKTEWFNFSAKMISIRMRSYAQTTLQKLWKKNTKTKNGCIDFIRDHERRSETQVMLMFATCLSALSTIGPLWTKPASSSTRIKRAFLQTVQR